MRKGSHTRDRILDIAESGVLAKGFGATSIEEIVAEAGITKNGFFYHFSDKNDLARALLQRYIDNEEAVLDQLFAATREEGGDPLTRLLEALEGMARMMRDLPTGHPGCLVATYCYSERMFDAGVRDLNRAAVQQWRERFLPLLEAIAERHPPRDQVSLSAVADMISNTVEGGIILSKALGEPDVLPDQILLLRSYLRLLFSPVDA
nr:TetR/AcrR family transcriptional regulator [Brevundimonas sp. A19_0]